MEKPLHVRVAEALGLGPHKVRAAASDHFVEVWTDNPYWLSDGQHRETELRSIPIPRYDTDWRVTGPLIERFRINVLSADDLAPGAWQATCRQYDGIGPTPLISICNLIRIHGVGKLAA